MYTLKVELEFNNFDLFDNYELQGAEIMADYQGHIDAILDLELRPDKSGKETHIISFPCETLFKNYQSSAARQQLAKQRQAVITNTVISHLPESN